METTATQNDYRVNLEVFEGPLDLLLYLIKKNDLDIYDIPVAFILEEYLRYLDTLKEMNIDLAGEFLLMAADLTHIKSKMLLPGEDVDAEDDEGVDPRADLVRRLLEYQRYKEASDALLKRSMLGRDVFVRQEKIEVKDGTARVERVTADGYEVVEASLPAVITVSNEVGEPRYPTIKGIMAVKKVEPTVWKPADIGVEPSQVGAAGQRAGMLRLFQPVHEGQCEFSEGETPEEAAVNLALKLREARVL